MCVLFKSARGTKELSCRLVYVCKDVIFLGDNWVKE